MKTYWTNGGIIPRIINLGTWSALRPWYPLGRLLRGPTCNFI